MIAWVMYPRVFYNIYIYIMDIMDKMHYGREISASEFFNMNISVEIYNSWFFTMWNKK